MYRSSQGSTGSGPSRGPAIYYGYCGRSGRYRMMDLPEYMSSMQEGMSRWMNDTATIYQDVLRDYPDAPQGTYGRPARDCGCGCKEHPCDCHCECCVCDADVLVHARCGEVRRIPITFENDTRREKPVRLELGKFVTAGGRDLGWVAALSDSEFTLRPCGEQTVTLAVGLRCDREPDKGPNAAQPSPPPPAQPNAQPDARTGGGVEGEPTAVDRLERAFAIGGRFGSVDRCEVGYATIRAEGCLTRPVVVAVAALPDDCDAYRHPCGCGYCH